MTIIKLKEGNLNDLTNDSLLMSKLRKEISNLIIIVFVVSLTQR